MIVAKEFAVMTMPIVALRGMTRYFQDVEAPLAYYKRFGRRLGRHAGTYFALVGTGTMLFGGLRGTLLGPIRSVASLATPYGLTWLAALIVTAAIAVLGARAIGPAAIALYDTDVLWLPGRDGQASPRLNAARNHLAVLGRWQLGGFALVLATMALLGVGL